MVNEMSSRDRIINCEACEGSGVTVFSAWVYENGCGYAHDSTDERPCEDCLGTGRVKLSLAAWLDEPRNPSTEEELPF